MKKIFTSLLFLLPLLIFVGCEKVRPIVDFYYEDMGNGEYYFLNKTYWSDYDFHSYDAALYIDGSKVCKFIKSNEYYYSFKTSGNHTVELEIYDYDTEKYYSEEKTIYVSLSSGGGTSGGGTGDDGDNTSYPIARFDYDFFDNFEIDFYNGSDNATSYVWSFGDGNSSTEENPSHRYSKPGTYTVTLTARNNKGTHQATAQIVITKPAYTYFLGITYKKVPKYNHNYKFKLTDDDIFTTTWGDSYWRTITSTPYEYTYATPHLLDGLSDDDYYELTVYMDNENSNGIIGGFKIPTTYLTQDYATDLLGTSSDNLTQVVIHFSYEKEPLYNSPTPNNSSTPTKIKKGKCPIKREMAPIIK